VTTLFQFTTCGDIAADLRSDSTENHRNHNDLHCTPRWIDDIVIWSTKIFKNSVMTEDTHN